MLSPKSVQYFPLVVCPIKYFSEKKLLKPFPLNWGQFVKMHMRGSLYQFSNGVWSGID